MDDKEFEEKYYSIQDLKDYMKLPVSRKLECLEEMNKFVNAFSTEKTKKIRDKLREEGY